MGTGCGVLSFYLLKHNCQKITATDINPPALKSLQYELEKHPLAARVNVRFASLFEGLDLSTVDLLVFNPPWIPEQIANLLDLAVHYEDGFFEQFFAQASEHLLPETLLVMPFSTFGLAAGITTRHPIAQEIKGKRFELIEHISQPLQQAPSKSRNWLANIRQNENDELWVLQKKSIRKL